jgi:hypothetical protein
VGTIFHLFAAALLAAVFTPALADEPVRANDFPTTARVEFVLECMKNSKASAHEMVYKCSCAVDNIASKVSYETWVDLSTVAMGTTIAGERGGVIRDMKDGRKLINTYRDLQAQAKHACFISD